MRINLKSGLTRVECEQLREKCNFTEDEQAVFNLRVTGKARKFIADVLGMSVSTVDRRLHGIKEKISRSA